MLGTKRRICLLILPVVALFVLVAGQVVTVHAADDGSWVEAIKIDGTAGAGNEVVTKEFELPHAAKVKIKWDLTPNGNAAMFRATLGSWKDDEQKYVNTGVIVRAGSASSKEQAGKLPAGKHRVAFSMKHMKYSFSIHYQR